MRRHTRGEYLALPQGRMYEPEIARYKVAESAMDQARGSPRRRPTEVSRVHERHPEPHPGRVESHPGTDYAAADHEQVEHARTELFQRALPKHPHHSTTLSAARGMAHPSTMSAMISKACEGSSGYTGRKTRSDIICNASLGEERPAGAPTTAMLLVAWLASRPRSRRARIKASGSATTTGKSQCVLFNDRRPGCNFSTRKLRANCSPALDRLATRSPSNVFNRLESMATSGAEGRCLRRRKNVASDSRRGNPRTTPLTTASRSEPSFVQPRASRP